jgi:hypothetical protein
MTLSRNARRPVLGGVPERKVVGHKRNDKESLKRRRVEALARWVALKLSDYRHKYDDGVSDPAFVDKQIEILYGRTR